MQFINPKTGIRSPFSRSTLLNASIATALIFTPLYAMAEADVRPEEPSSMTSPPSTSEASLDTKPITEAREDASLGQAIDSFLKNPTAENRASMKVARAKLDLEIAQWEARDLNASEQTEAEAKIQDLEQYRAAQMRRLPKETQLALNPPQTYSNRLANKGVHPTKETNTEGKIVSGARSVGRSAKNGAKFAWRKTESGAEKVAEKTGEGAHKVKRTLAKAARKTKESIEDATR